MRSCADVAIGALILTPNRLGLSPGDCIIFPIAIWCPKVTTKLQVVRWSRSLSALDAIFVSFALACTPALAQAGNTATRNDLSNAIIVALIGGIGWIAAYVLNGERDDRTKRLQLTIDHTSTQIREFYAPLIALTDQLNTMAGVKDTMVQGKDDKQTYDLSAAMHERFFLPIHEEINIILKTKVHLLEELSTPPSFIEYFRHYASEKAYWQLALAGKDVGNVQVPPYPSAFYWDVRRGYESVIARYDSSLGELRKPRWARLPWRSVPVPSAPPSGTRQI